MSKKDTFYFSHDYNARSDDKIKELLFRHGAIGYGIYWMLIEDLYNNTNVIRSNYERIAYELRVDINVLRSVIHDFDLFDTTEEIIFSKSVGRRLEEREKRSENAKKSISKRWESADNSSNSYERNTNVIRTNEERNTIKERKGKENKGKERKEEIENEPLFSRPKIFFGTEKLQIKWNEWRDYLSLEHQKSWRTIQAEELAMRDLFQLSGGNENEAIEIIEYSMRKTYKSLQKNNNYQSSITHSNNTSDYDKQPAHIRKSLEKAQQIIANRKNPTSEPRS